MPTTAKCPECRRIIDVDPETKRAWCKRCQTAANPIDDKDAEPHVAAGAPRRRLSEPSQAGDSRPRRTRREEYDDEPDEPRGASPWLFVGLAVGAVVVIGSALLALVLVLRSRPDAPVAAVPAAEAPPAPQPGEPPPVAPVLDIQEDRTLPFAANALAFDPRRAHLYIAVSAKAPADANTIVAVDPVKGERVWSVNVGSDPAVLALSDDSRALWVGLRGAGVIQRVDLGARAAGPFLHLGQGSFGPTFPEQMVVLPGMTDSLVISLQRPGFSPRHDGVAIFDNGTRRLRKTGDHTGSNRIVLVERNLLYGYNNETTEFGLRKLLVGPDGITEERPVLQEVIGGFGVDIVFGAGRIFSTRGHVVDAATGKRVGMIPAQGSVAVDAAGKTVFYLDPEKKAIESFNTVTLAPVGTRKVEADANLRGLTALGDSGLAYFSETRVYVVSTKGLR
jgi:hypothetical protein